MTSVSSTHFANTQFHSFRFEQFHFIVHKIRGFALFGYVKVDGLRNAKELKYADIILDELI